MTAARAIPTRHAKGRRWLQLTASTSVAAGLLWLCFHSVKWVQVATVLESARLPWLTVAVILNGSILIVWAAFFCAVAPVAEPVAFSRMFDVVAVSWAIMNALPLFAGQASVVVMLIRRAKMTRHGAFSVLAIDQLGGGVSKVAIFLAVSLLAPIPGWMRAGIGTASVAVAALLGVLVVVAHSHDRLSRGVDTRAGWFARGHAFTADWARGLDTLRSWRRAAIALAYSLGAKAIELLAMIAVQRAFGISLSLGGALLVLAAVMLTTMFPVAPANLGTYEASVAFVYRGLGLSAEQALAVAIVQHLCFLIPVMVAGGVVLAAPKQKTGARGLDAFAP